MKYHILNLRSVFCVLCVLWWPLLSRSSDLYGPVVFFGNVSTGTYSAVDGIAVATTIGGIYTNGVYTNYYRLSATNAAGRIPTSTNIVVTFTGNTNSTNAVLISWTRAPGIYNHVIERSHDQGSTWTNWLALSPSTTNWTDTGTNAWAATDFESIYAAIPVPSYPWATAAQGAKADSAFQVDGSVPGGPSAWGGVTTSNMGLWSLGATRRGGGSGTMTMGDGNYGSSQIGYNEGTMSIGIYSYGAYQRGACYGVASIGDNAFGATQIGQMGPFSVGGTMRIGDYAYGAHQIGSVAGAATNNGVGSFQLLNLAPGQSAVMTGNASLSQGAADCSDDHAIVSGDGMVSHGKATHTAGGGYWWGTTNLATYLIPQNSTNDVPSIVTPRYLGDRLIIYSTTNKSYTAYGTTTNDWGTP